MFSVSIVYVFIIVFLLSSPVLNIVVETLRELNFSCADTISDSQEGLHSVWHIFLQRVDIC